MSDLLTSALDAAHQAHHVVMAVPDPGEGAAPPGSEKLLTILKWVAWTVFGLCVAGLLMVAGTMAIQWKRGESSEAMAGLGKVMFACVIAASASGIVGALV